MSNFLTMEYISTFMGLIFVTSMMVQFLKDLPYIKLVSTRYVTFFIALFNIIVCSVILGNFTLAGLYLMVLNSMLVTFSATGGYDFVAKKVNMKVDDKIVDNTKDDKIVKRD